MVEARGIGDAEWPAPVDVVNEHGRSDVVLLCEHASGHMPAEYADLGLTPADRFRHIVWDIGAAAVTRGLATRLDACAFLGNYSRLLIDLNRPLCSATSIPVRSEDTFVAGNSGLEESERERRVDRIFRPFHDRVATHLASREAIGRPTRIVAVHSFTPVFHGKRRPWHAGVLYDKSRAFGDAVIERLRDGSALNVDANVPYVISRDEDYTVPVHGEDRGHDAILIEVRQDLISSPAGVTEWIDRLATAISGSLQIAAPSQTIESMAR